MKKRIISVAAMIGFLFILCVVATKSSQIQTSDTRTTNITYAEPKPEIIQEIQLYNEEILIENEISNMQKEFDEIESISNNKDWYVAYKEIVEKYSYILDPPESVYDYYTDDEIYLIQRMVETECYQQDFESKVMVANVAFNRHESGLFGESMTDVITNKNQFAYGRKIISEDTVLAVEFAYEIVDLTNGCIGFRSGVKKDTWNGWKRSFTDENSGHHFYKIVEEE